VIADKAYSHPSTLEALRAKGISAVIPVGIPDGAEMPAPVTTTTRSNARRSIPAGVTAGVTAGVLGVMSSSFLDLSVTVRAGSPG
jgi:hypothetical protein